MCVLVCVCVCVCVYIYIYIHTHTYIYDWVTLLCSRNWNDIVNQLYSNKKINIKDGRTPPFCPLFDPYDAQDIEPN